MFGHPLELELEEPLEPEDGVVAVEDGVVVVAIVPEPELDPDPVAAFVIAAAPPAITPVTAIVASAFRSGMFMVVRLLSVLGLHVPVNCRAL